MTEPNRSRLIYRYLLALVIPTLVCLVVVTADLILHPVDIDVSGSVLVRLLSGGITAPVTLVVGLLIMRRVPNNVIGPLLILWTANITVRTLRTNIDLPADWLSYLSLFSDLGWYSLLIIAVYFPTGRSYWLRYERWVDLLCAAVLLFIIPQRIPIFAFLQPILRNLGVFIVLLMILAPVSLVLRYRTAGSRERQQMKWLVWGFMLFLATAIPFKLILWTTTSIDDYANEIYSRIVFIFPAIAIGNAILRHRLYDIDIIIRRTLVYSLLTAALAAIYFGSVIVTQQIIRAVTGQSSDLAIVVSTLLIAALFTPLRRRVQDGIDRRFFRRKYDAQKTLEAFSIATRDEVDLDKLQAELIGVVQETMQPSKVALWVKEDQA